VLDLRHTSRLPLVFVRFLLSIHILRGKAKATLGFGQAEIDVSFHVDILACIGRDFNAACSIPIGAVREIEVSICRCGLLLIFRSQFPIRLQLRVKLGNILTIILGGLVGSFGKFSALLADQKFL
jgi:hypothetical protein